jgi:hypothetical protein
VAGRPLSYTQEQARKAIATSYSWAESLRKLDLCPTGGGWRVLKKYAEIWEISTEHFDPARAREANPSFEKQPIHELLVENSSASRQNLKRRLYQEGLKEPRCQMCGQDEFWRGQRMAMILDHINGVRNDNRIENLGIVCPNCAATLPTHCGRKNRLPRKKRRCRRCSRSFLPTNSKQRYCSQACGVRWDRSKLRGRPNPSARRTKRPPYEQLLAEIEASSYCAVGRKYGVSDNAVRKWVRFYEREREQEAQEASP